MNCDRYRIAASARLDGEPVGMSVAVLDHHLVTCVECARWVTAATRVTRQARLDATAVPDLADGIVATIVLPARRVARRRLWLRIGLVLAALAQLAVGLPAVLGDSVAMPMAAHATHEMAAWNLALAAAFAAVALLPRRASGMIPLLGTFLVVLTALSVQDVLDGAVGAGRLATHAAALVGLALLILLDRSEQAEPPAHAAAVPQRDEQGDADLRTVA